MKTTKTVSTFKSVTTTTVERRNGVKTVTRVRRERSRTTVTTTEAAREKEVMARYRLYKPAVMPSAARNALITRNYARLLRDIGASPYAKSLGDESASIIGELLVLTARTFDAARYTNPLTRMPFTVADIGDGELDRVFRNFVNQAINTGLGRAVEKRRRETATDFGADDAPAVRCREFCPAFLAEVNDLAGRRVCVA